MQCNPCQTKNKSRTKPREGRKDTHQWHAPKMRLLAIFIGRGSAMLHRLPNILSPLWGSSVPQPKSRSDGG